MGLEPAHRIDSPARRNRPRNTSDLKTAAANATTNATTTEAASAQSDGLLLKLIQAWPRLTAARQRMIVAIIETTA
jgi:hypothetical protein